MTKKSIIKSVITDNPTDDNLSIASYLIRNNLVEEQDVHKLKGYVAYIRHLMKVGDSIEPVIEVPTEVKVTYHVIDGNYNWDTRMGTIELPVQLIDELFFDYSTHGRDMSQTAILNKYNLQPWQWNSIKAKLYLQKSSHVFSPYTVENTPKDLLDKMISDKISKVFKVGDKVEKIYSSQLRKHYLKSIEGGSVRKNIIQSVVTELSDLLQINPPVKYTPVDNNIGSDTSYVVVGDLHIGAKVRGLPITQDFDDTSVVSRLNESLSYIKPKPKIHLIILGDVVESFTGRNHSNSWQEMSFKSTGAPLIVKTYHILRDYIAQVQSRCSILQVSIVSGNHDRLTSARENDMRGGVAEIVAEMLRISFTNIKIDYDPFVLSYPIGDKNLIITHGHLPMCKKFNASKVIVDYGTQSKYTLILSAHLHTAMIPQDTKSYRWVVIPPIFTGNTYSETEGYNSQAGITIIEERDNSFSLTLEPLL